MGIVSPKYIIMHNSVNIIFNGYFIHVRWSATLQLMRIGFLATPRLEYSVSLKITKIKLHSIFNLCWWHFHAQPYLSFDWEITKWFFFLLARGVFMWERMRIKYLMTLWKCILSMLIKITTMSKYPTITNHYKNPQA